MCKEKITRRNFLAVTAVAATSPWIVPSRVLGKNGGVAPSNRITLAVVGLGPRNTSNLGHFLAQSDVQCVAVCDCFADRRKRGKEMVDQHYGTKDCLPTRFHEELLDRRDIDALLIGTGDRWHAVLSILAARAGKDAYCEKPSAGIIADMGAHYFDFAQWAHQSELSGPIEYEGTGVWPPAGGLAEVPFDVNVEAGYADGVRVVIRCGDKGVRFDGDRGWIHCSDFGDITAQPKWILRERSVPRVDWAFMGDHVRNFLECIKSRKLANSHPELAQRAHTMIHCANLALRLGRKVRWDPEAERFVNDDDANRMISRTMRTPWEV